jgi:hypothetical protein
MQASKEETVRSDSSQDMSGADANVDADLASGRM